MPELKASVKSKSVRFVLGAFGGGAGVAVGIAAIEALRSRPEFLPQLLNSGFLGFAALVVGMVIFRKQFETFNAVQERHAIAQEQLAANIGALVSKDDQRVREQELTLNHLARQSDRILEELEKLRTASE